MCERNYIYLDMFSIWHEQYFIRSAADESFIDDTRVRRTIFFMPGTLMFSHSKHYSWGKISEIKISHVIIRLIPMPYLTLLLRRILGHKSKWSQLPGKGSRNPLYSTCTYICAPAIIFFLTFNISGVSHMHKKWGWFKGVLYFNPRIIICSPAI